MYHIWERLWSMNYAILAIIVLHTFRLVPACTFRGREGSWVWDFVAEEVIGTVLLVVSGVLTWGLVGDSGWGILTKES